jgi:hypothetical protein
MSDRSFGMPSYFRGRWYGLRIDSSDLWFSSLAMVVALASGMTLLFYISLT